MGNHWHWLLTAARSPGRSPPAAGWGSAPLPSTQDPDAAAPHVAEADAQLAAADHRLSEREAIIAPRRQPSRRGIPATDSSSRTPNSRPPCRRPPNLVGPPVDAVRAGMGPQSSVS